jgi:predicted transposase/invertase (TIGR01784 family)
MQGGVGSNDALKKSIIYAMKYCREHHILEWFFNNLTMEEENMLATEWNLEEALEVRAEEAWEDGWGEGKFAIARNLLARGWAVEEIAETTELPIEKIHSLVR